MKTRILLLTAILLAACGTADHYDIYEGSYEEQVDTRAVASSPEGAEYDEVDSSAEKKMVREGSMEMRGKNVHAVKGYIDGQVSKYRGYYSAENFGGSDNRYEPDVYRLEVRIPSQSFDDFVAAVGQSGAAVERVSIQAVDVTDRYIDYEMRLASKKSYLERYRQLLGRLTTVKDIVEMQERIRALEEEIESTEARFRELAGRIQYSTLAIIIRPVAGDAPVYKAPSFFRQAGKALSSGWTLIKDLVIGLLYIWPLLVLGAAAIFGWRRYRGRSKGA